VKKALWILLPCLAVLGMLFLGLRSCQREMWERALYGPFTGTPYTGSVTTAPTSVLAIRLRGQLEVHELPSYTNPVVLFRSADGSTRWSRLFVPEEKWQDGAIHYAGVRELRLRSWERRSNGAAVFFTCDWDWGGKEGGLIELGSDCEFKSFSVSW